MTLSLSKRVYLVVGTILAGTVLVALVSWNSVRRLSQEAQRLGEVNLASITTLWQASRFYESQSAIVNRAPAQTDLKALQKMVQDFTEANRQLDGRLASVKKLDAQGAIAGPLEQFASQLPALRQASSNVFELAAQFQQVEAANLLQSQVNGLQDQASDKLNQMAQAALAAAEVQPARIAGKAQSDTRLILGLCLVVLIGSTVLAAWLVRQKVVRPIKSSADRLADTFGATEAAVHSINQISQSLAEGASVQAASLEETGASLEEMASMTKRNAENAGQAKALASETRQAADAGSADMQSMNQAMEEIKAASSNIANIIKTIDEIAFQTNILALNAAVEAARAGEAGMGFAVVADEVRNLAQRSAQAAKETSAKIEGALSKIGQGVEISSKVSHALQEIVARIRQVDELVAQVAAASSEQNQGIQQVSVAVSQMDKVTQANAASAQESAHAATDLQSHATTSKKAVSDLMALVEGSAGEIAA